MAVPTGRWSRALQVIWLALFVDLLALVLLSLLASVSDAQSWTADILVNGFFLIPMLATTQLRPLVGITITLPGVAAYFATSAAARYANTEPWSSVGLRTGVLASLSLACVLLCAVQRSRVLTIAGLVSDRAELTGQLVDVEGRARRQVAEELHDGALQYVLAARQDLEDVRAGAEATSFDRLEFALRETTSLLRAKVSQLHPAVLAEAGLLRALEDLVRSTAERSGTAITFVSRGWDAEGRTGVDEIVYGAARELLTNVARHAHAQTADVRLDLDAVGVRLTVVDDGDGIPDGILATRLADGHVGLASQRVRIEAAGGRLSLRANPLGTGTVATVELPARQAGDDRGGRLDRHT